MCIYCSHVAKLPSKIFTFILIEWGCSQPWTKKTLFTVALVRAETRHVLSAANKRLINLLPTPGFRQCRECHKEDGTGGWGSALQCRDTTTVLRSTQRLWLSAQGQPSPTCSMDGWAVCSPGPSPWWEATGPRWMLREGEPFSFEDAPIARFLCKWLGPGPRTYGQG